MIFMIIFTMEYIRLLGSSVDPILVAMTSYLMVSIEQWEDRKEIRHILISTTWDYHNH